MKTDGAGASITHTHGSLRGAAGRAGDHRLSVHKVRALLAFLAVEMARPHPRETLAGLLWPNVPDGCAHHSLNQALSNLRCAIHDHETTPPFLIVASQSIQFNGNSDHWVDVEELGRLVRRSGGETGRLVGGEEDRLEARSRPVSRPVPRRLLPGR